MSLYKKRNEFGFLGGLFGKKVKAPEIRKVALTEVFGGALSNLPTQLREMFTASGENIKMAGDLTKDIPDLVRKTGEAPTLEGSDLAEYNNAQDTYKNFLNLAKTNTINETGVGLKAAASGLGLKGILGSGAGANSLFSGIAAKSQGNLNNISAATGEALLNYRSTLLNNVYQRLLNRLGATTSASGQLYSQGNTLFGTALNTANSERTYMTNVDSQNAQMKFSADSANAAAFNAGLNGLASAGTSLATAFLGKCWVAAAVCNDDWSNLYVKYFRVWLLNLSPRWFSKLYFEHGQNVAKIIRKFPILKKILKPFIVNQAAKGFVFLVRNNQSIVV